MIHNINGIFLIDCEDRMKKYANGKITDMTPDERDRAVKAVKDGENSVELENGMWCLISDEVVNALSEDD